ncbi:AGAMOUS-like 104 [Prunus dulcis]|uniref:AGAMOUS-like 104 n=1 Tax=Prunus dulcis TaxID=3755 RepID=A0A4Y1QV68_PRUDU|nr:AGAMOUS-like 104 [Prunus dulcis]
MGTSTGNWRTTATTSNGRGADKEYLLSNHLSSYDSSGMPQVLPGSFENEVAGWLSSGGHNQAQIYDASAPLDHQLRNLSSTLYDPFSQGTSSNADPSSMGECHHTMVGSNMSEIMPHEQVDIPVGSPNVQAYNEGAEYHENKVPQLNGH